jgi:hypothetical protein
MPRRPLHRLLQAELLGTLGALGALALAACAPRGPVLRYPWLEDYTLALEHELLLVRIQGDEVLVGARFGFRSLDTQRDRVLTFPVPPPCSDAQGFSARLARPGLAPLPLATWLGVPDVLPAGEARQTYEIELPGRALEAYEGILLVSYAQRCDRAFRYTLRTGAYWAGAIGRLDVVVDDPGGRVIGAGVEGRGPGIRTGTSYLWSFVELEPAGGLELELRPSPASGFKSE